MPASRVVAVDDISIRSGDGRTVEAYAAVFNQPTRIVDQDGDYDEQIARSAFDKSLAERRDRIFPLYHHGKTLHGTPSDMGSVPIGRTVDIRPDSKGLLTVTRINDGQWGDQILDAIRSGSLRGMSFTGTFIRSDPQLRPGQKYRPDAHGKRTLVTRHEIGLIEYGPTPMPAYQGAEVVGVRAADGTVQTPARQWSPQERENWLIEQGIGPAADRLGRAHALDEPPQPTVLDRIDALDDLSNGRRYEMINGQLVNRWCEWCLTGRSFIQAPGHAYYICERCAEIDAVERPAGEAEDMRTMATARARQAFADRQARSR